MCDVVALTQYCKLRSFFYILFIEKCVTENGVCNVFPVSEFYVWFICD